MIKQYRYGTIPLGCNTVKNATNKLVDPISKVFAIVSQNSEMLAKSSVACVHSQPSLHNQTTVAFNHFYNYT